MINLKKLMSSF